LTPHHLRIAAELLDFHRCPNTGRVLHSTKGDDKAFCRCGETPPVHLKDHMVPATVDDFVEQELWSGVVDRHAPGLPEPFKPSGIVLLPESADPIANPVSGTYHWIDTDGKHWIRTTDGKVYPHPLFGTAKEDE
jgi:hypothetical protein